MEDLFKHNKQWQVHERQIKDIFMRDAICSRFNIPYVDYDKLDDYDKEVMSLIMVGESQAQREQESKQQQNGGTTTKSNRRL